MTPELPFVRSLTSSRREEDRELWLRIAADILSNANAEAATLDSAFEADVLNALDTVPEDARLALAKRVVAFPHASERLVQRLAERADLAGLWTIGHASRLSSETICRALDDPARARELARRPDLDGATIDDLAMSDDTPTLAALAANAHIALSRRVVAGLVERARAAAGTDGDASLAEALLSRALAADCAPLFLVASFEARTEILIAAQRSELGQPRTPSLGAVDPEMLFSLERHALEGRLERLAGDLGALIDCPLELARRIVDDPTGEPLATALVALRAPSDLMVRTLTALDLVRGGNYRRLGALGRLQGLLTPSAATIVIAALTGAKLSRQEPPAARRPPPSPAEAAPAARRPTVSITTAEGIPISPRAGRG